MSHSKKIVVTISPEGDTSVEAVGYIGGTCKQATAPLVTRLLGSKPLNDIVKPEFYQIPQKLSVTERS